MSAPSMSVVHAEAGDLRDLSARDYVGVVYRGIKRALADNVTNLAAAIAYYAFLAIPSALLVAVGAFSVFAGPDAINNVLDHLSPVMPASAVNLIGDTLTRTTQAQSGGLVMIVVGFLLALWTLSGAMQTVMWALTAAYGASSGSG
jgi:membrane protein